MRQQSHRTPVDGRLKSFVILPSHHPHSRLEQCLLVVLSVVLAYLALAYLALPALWNHYEHQRRLADLPMVTRTAQGIPGDPINVGLIGDKLDVLCAMRAAGWYPADPVTLRSSIEIAGSVLLDRPYHDAPVSPLFYLGRHEDFAFEKPVGGSADRRHHVRFWKVLDQGQEKRPVWLGDATFDRGVGVSHYTGAITHHISADIDAERGLLAADLEAAQDGRCQISGDRHRRDAGGAKRRRRFLLHRRRGVDLAAGRGVPKTDNAGRHHSKPDGDRDQGPDLARCCQCTAKIALMWRFRSPNHLCRGYELRNRGTSRMTASL